jgi:beta-N-acetylhexosaminidase
VIFGAGMQRREFIRRGGFAAALLSRGPWLTQRVAMAGLLTNVPTLRADTASTVEQDVGAMLMLGWSGTTIESFSAQVLARHVAAGRAGGVFFVKENVGSLEDVRSLVRLFSAKATPLIAIDHEGGWVQRLTERHGVSRLPTAQSVADSLSPDRAQALYAQAGSEIARLGFTLNLAPVVDLHDPTNPAIGHFGRAFDADPVRVLAYARAFVDGFAEAGVLCALKHFPGNGHTLGDSHHGPADGSNWSERDLAPYAQLIAAGRARLIMAGHAQIPSLEPRPVPVSLSEPVMRGLLRQRLNFNGVAMTDDLDMQAVSSLMPRREAVIKAISAGNDLLMIRNVGDFDPELPRRVVAWVQEAIAAGTLSRAQIAEAADRVRGLQGVAPAVSFR